MDEGEWGEVRESMKYHSFPISVFILVLLGVTLTSCGTAPASPTSIPPETQTATLEIPTQTPSPTATPESQLPIGPVSDLAEKIKSGYEITWNNEKTYMYVVDKETNEQLSDIQIYPNGTWSRVYQYMDFTGENIKDNEGNLVQLDGIVVLPQPMEKITVDPNSILSFDFPGYTWNPETKLFERKFFEGEPVLNTIEAQLETIKYGDPNVDTFYKRQYDHLFTFGGYYDLTINDLREPAKGLYTVNRRIPVLQEDGSYVLIPTTHFSLNVFVKNDLYMKYSFELYQRSNGEKRVIIIDQPYLNSSTNIEGWSEYYKNHEVDDSGVNIVQ